MNRFLTILLAAILFSSQYSCSQKKKQDQASGKKPVETSVKSVLDVTSELKEISGISFLDEKNLVAIEDEEGQLYYYDTDAKKVTVKKEFAGPGDYEDVAVAGNDIYIVDSKGSLYVIRDFRTSAGKAEIVATAFKGKNNIEGLAYDASKNRLLLAPKDEGLDGDKKDVKEVFEYSLANKTLNPAPVYAINLGEIEAYYKGDELEESSKKFLKALGNENLNKVFRTSALGINPKTKELYLLSSINNLVAILTPDGKLRKIIHLKGSEFSQPEGLSFTPSGRLFISNEGKNTTPANIIELDYTP